MASPLPGNRPALNALKVPFGGITTTAFFAAAFVFESSFSFISHEYFNTERGFC
jgi:hypothetical protein